MEQETAKANIAALPVLLVDKQFLSFSERHLLASQLMKQLTAVHTKKHLSYLVMQALTFTSLSALLLRLQPNKSLSSYPFIIIIPLLGKP